MTKEQLEIIHSILNQIGGLFGPEDLNIIVMNRKDFYNKWNKFTNKSVDNLKSLTEAEKSFIFRSTIIINNKLVSGEAQTLTGYEDDERADAIKALAVELKVNPILEQPLEEIPDELRT